MGIVTFFLWAICLTVMVVILGGSFWFGVNYQPRRLENWAFLHGYRILRSEQCHFFKGPFTFASSRSQPVYYVTVEDREGRQQTGWVRCGDSFLGVLSDEIAVKWERRSTR